MDDFTQRLKWCQGRGALTISDLARLFDRERRTMTDWINNGRLPTGPRAKEAFKRLAQLEVAIEQKRGFPVPLRLSKRARVEYIRLLGEGNFERASILASGVTTRKRGPLVRRLRRKENSRARKAALAAPVV